MTPRLTHETVPPIVDLPAEAAKATGSSLMSLGRHVPPRPISVQVISFSPRVRILHNFVTEHEAAHLIKIAEPRYHRSSTARAGSDDKRTSNSAMLDSSDSIVSAVRHRIAFYAGYARAHSLESYALLGHPTLGGYSGAPPCAQLSGGKSRAIASCEIPAR